MLRNVHRIHALAHEERKWHGTGRLLENFSSPARSKEGVAPAISRAQPLEEGIAKGGSFRRGAFHFIEPFKYLFLWRTFIRDYKKLREDLSRKNVNTATYIFLLNSAVADVAGKLSGAFLGGYLALNGSHLAASSGPFIANLLVGTVAGNIMWFLTAYKLFHGLAADSASKAGKMLGAAWELEKEVLRMFSRPTLLSLAFYGAAGGASYLVGSYAGAAAAGSLSALSLFLSLTISLPIVAMVNKHAIERLAKRLGIPKQATSEQA